MQFKASPALVDLRAVRRKAVDQTRDKRLSDGFVYLGHTFQIDDKSMVRIIGSASAFNIGAPFPVDFFWRDANNVAVPMDQAQFIEFAKQTFSYVYATMRHSFALKDGIESSLTPEQIDINLGW